MQSQSPEQSPFRCLVDPLAFVELVCSSARDACACSPGSLLQLQYGIMNLDSQPFFRTLESGWNQSVYNYQFTYRKIQ